MDSKYSGNDSFLDAIKEKINSGELTSGEMCSRLEKAIDLEINKPTDEMDIPFLHACQDLLYTLNNSEEYVSKQPQYEQELMQRIKKTQRSRKTKRRAFAAVGIAAAMLVLFIVGDGLLYREWLEGDSSVDEQQYNVAGNVVDPGLVEKGNATGSEETRDVTTDDFSEATEVLGFTPLMPTWYPEGWEHHSYYAAQEASWQWFYEIRTSAENENFLIYEIMRYDDVTDANEYFEQSEHGKKVPCNGWDVYIAVNIDDPVAIWIDGNYCYSLNGPLTEDELLKIIDSIKKEE